LSERRRGLQGPTRFINVAMLDFLWWDWSSKIRHYTSNLPVSGLILGNRGLQLELAQLPQFAREDFFLRRGIGDSARSAGLYDAKTDVVKTKSPRRLW
jgi:hypothetical protein